MTNKGWPGKRSNRIPIQLGDLGYIALSEKEFPEYSLIDWEDAEIAAQFTWSKSIRGYAEARDLRNGGRILLHKLVFKGQGPEIDHKNRDPLDNRKQNLRGANRSQQLCNTAPRPNSTGFRGVFKRENGRYSARVEFEGTRYSLGTYDTPEEAARARDKAATSIQGDFAVLNFSAELK